MLTQAQETRFREFEYLVSKAVKQVPFYGHCAFTDREDMYQEGCLVLLKLIAQNHDAKDFRAFVYRAIQNRLIDLCKKGRRLCIHEIQPPSETAACLPDVAEQVVNKLDLEHAVKKIAQQSESKSSTVAQGSQAILYRLNGLTTPEIARIYKKDKSYVTACISRARSYLKKAS